MTDEIKIAHQTDYVIDIELSREFETKVEENTTEDNGFQLVDIDQFQEIYRQYFPKATKTEAFKYWHSLFGNSPDSEFLDHEKNTQARYLTNSSCAKILEFRHKFKHGIDFQHLSKGFFIAKNPDQQGIRDVLHYNDYIAKNIKVDRPFSITLTEKREQKEHKEEKNIFEHPQSQWYEFLRTRRQSPEGIYCTEEELKKAFVEFSNIIKGSNLSFFEGDFSLFKGFFNPIILLGRWSTIISNPHLKKEDREMQWRSLPRLNVADSFSPIRAITDYQYTKTPCGFILPEMFSNSRKFNFICPEENELSSSDLTEERFWRYIAFQPKRNSINFYQAGRNSIKKIEQIKPASSESMQVLLVNSTTAGERHLFKLEEDETLASQIWDQICLIIESSPTRNNFLRIASALSSNASGEFKNEFISRLTSFKKPSIEFLRSTCEFIDNYLVSCSILKLEENLIELAIKTNYLTKRYNEDFYRGYRFYLINKEWPEDINIKQYCELQYLLDQSAHINPLLKASIIANFSTFNFKIEKDLQWLEQLLIREIPSNFNVTPTSKKVKYCLDIFKDVTCQLNLQNIEKIIADISKLGGDPDSIGFKRQVLVYVEQNYSKAFAENYFNEKREELEQAYQNGLTDLQINRIRGLRFSPISTDLCIAIESTLARSSFESEDINKINDYLLILSNILMQEDFELFLNRIHTIKEHLSREPKIIFEFLDTLIKKKSLGEFNQIYFCNEREQCHDEFLLNKFIIYINQIMPLYKKSNINSIKIQELLAGIVLNSPMNSLIYSFTKAAGLEKNFKKILALLEDTQRNQPHAIELLIELIRSLPDEKTLSYISNLTNLVGCIDNLHKILPPGVDEVAKFNMLLFFSVLEKFRSNPLELIDLIVKIEKFNLGDQKDFLYLAKCLIKKSEDIVSFRKLTELLRDPETLILIKAYCKNPPFPCIVDLINWLTDAKTLKDKYELFSLIPFGQRRLENAFILSDYEKQKADFVDVEGDIFTKEVGNSLNTELKQNRRNSVNTLVGSYQTLKNTKPLNQQQKLQLLCICIEMLARTTSQWDKGTNRAISQELNATQVMALYAMIMHNNTKLISQIDTGEGKSRINMVLAAYQAARGMTVDVMTSDMTLAERDYLTYNDFFSSLGIRTSLITLNTPKQLYQKGGVNFTDINQLVLLRNKSDIDLRPFDYLCEEEEQRCLLIDEEDKFRCDKSKDSYNYAAQSMSLINFIWVYPLLVKYVMNVSPNDTNFVAKKHTDAFLTFVRQTVNDDSRVALLAYLKEKNEDQMTVWLQSAHTAINKMEKDKIYKLTENIPSKLVAMRNFEGITRFSRRVLVVDDGRPVEGSTFSAGVHQCLCAKENIASGKEEFVIPPENETRRTSYPVSFMSKYKRGKIFGVSGTTRSDIPKQKPKVNYENYSFMKVPRHKKLIREDKNIFGAKDEEQQFKFVKRALLQKLKQNQPVLIICRDDNQSQKFHEMIKGDAELKRAYKALTRVHALSSIKEENTAISEGGIPGQITISTVGMFGRGIDIDADNLSVLSLYIPTIENEIQIKGRTARVGKPGEYRMIIAINDPMCPVNGRTYNLQSEVSKTQQKLASDAFGDEEVAKLYANFLENITEKFLSNYTQISSAGRTPCLNSWTVYLELMNKEWNIIRHDLLKALDESNKDSFIKLFQEFASKWGVKYPTAPPVPAGQSNAPNSMFFQDSKEATCIFDAIAAYKEIKPQRSILKAQRGYDMADDGQARIYSSLFAQELAVLTGERQLFANFRAWHQGRGALFADLKATLNGERPLFASLRAIIQRLGAALKSCFSRKEDEVAQPADIDDILFDLNRVEAKL